MDFLVMDSGKGRAFFYRLHSILSNKKYLHNSVKCSFTHVGQSGMI